MKTCFFSFFFVVVLLNDTNPSLVDGTELFPLVEQDETFFAVDGFTERKHGRLGYGSGQSADLLKSGRASGNVHQHRATNDTA